MMTTGPALFPKRSRRRLPAPPARRPGHRATRGAALITALLVVTLAAVLVSGLLWRQQVQIRRVENQRASQQARWVSRGSFDWTRLILRSEADSAAVTYLGGVWSVPIAETRLSTFLGKFGGAREEQGASTWLSGSIDDAQAKFNVRNLVTSAGPTGLSIDTTALAQFRKLMSLLGQDSRLADAVATQMRLSLQQSITRSQHAASGNVASDALAAATSGAGAGAAVPGGGYTDDPGLRGSDDGSGGRPLQIHDLDGLLDVPGFTPQTLERLTPFVTVLPVPTQLNLNTAPAEVIAASLPALSISQAQTFVRVRDQSFIINIADAQTRLKSLGETETLDSSRFDVTTRFFVVHGRVRHERAVVDRLALIYRDARTHGTHIIQVRDASPVE